jgi:hypothetical protein
MLAAHVLKSLLGREFDHATDEKKATLVNVVYVYSKGVVLSGLQNFTDLNGINYTSRSHG